MRKLMVFNSMSLDGFIADGKGDMSWAHRLDEEWSSFIAENSKREGVLVFGRVTYEMMASYWPTPMAAQNSPAVAKRMNELQKIVFSRTMEKASWANTRLVKGPLADEIRKLKEGTGPDLVIFGSGSIVAQLTRERLIDEYQLALNPIILGNGKPMFAGIADRVKLKRTSERTFANGNVFLCYEPAE